jgi:hypothetical protein
MCGLWTFLTCCKLTRPTGTTVERIRQIENTIFIVPLNQSKFTPSSLADNTARYLLDFNELLQYHELCI